MRSLGIDIGRFSIKVVELTVANRSYQFSGAKIYPMNINSVDNEVDIMQVLKQISKDFQTDNAKVVASIRQNYVSMRKMFFPFRERQKILKSLAFELEDEIPYSIDKAICDAKILSTHEKTAEVMAMACPVDEISQTIEMFNRAGIDPDIICPEFSAIANLYEPKWYLSPADQKKQALESTSQERMIINIGHSRSFVGLTRGEKLIWGRSILWGAEKIAFEIARSFQVPLSESIKMMPEKAFLLMTTESANPDQKRMSDTVANSLTPLIQALRLTIMLAKTRYETDISSIEICGGAANIKNLGPFLTQHLELPTNYSNPLDRLDGSKIRSLLPHKDNCHVAFGLAIEGLKKPVNPAVNFRQLDMAKKNQSWDKAWEKWGYTAKILAVAWLCFLIAGMFRESIATGLDEKSADLLTSQAKKVANLRNVTNSKVRKYIREQDKKAKLVKLYDQIDDIVSPLEVLQNLGNLLPANNKDPKFEVRYFNVKNQNLRIEGFSDNQTGIQKIERSLKSMATDGKLRPAPAVLPDIPGKTRFSYSINIKRKN